MQITAQISKDEVAAVYSYREGFGHYLTVSVPDGWQDVKKICKKILRHNGRAYTFTGWNSDTNKCYFRSTGMEVIAKISSK